MLKSKSVKILLSKSSAEIFLSFMISRMAIISSWSYFKLLLLYIGSKNQISGSLSIWNMCAVSVFLCARGSIILRCLSTLDSVLSHVAVGGRQRSDVTLVLFLPPPLSVADHILHAAVCRVCDAQPGGIHPLLPERSAGQLAGRLSTGETSGTSATPPHCPVVCPLIELSTQLWRLWLRKSNLIKPKNREGNAGWGLTKELLTKKNSLFLSILLSLVLLLWRVSMIISLKKIKNQWLKGRASVRAGWRPWVAVRRKQNYLSAGDSQLVIIQNSFQAPQSRRRLKDQLEKLHTKRQRKKMCKSKEFSFLKAAGFTVCLKCARFQITAVPRCNFKCLRSVIYP